MANLQEITTLSEHGSLTIPARICAALGLKGKQPIVVETNAHGEILLRPYSALMEDYTEERIDEFAAQDQELGALLKTWRKTAM